MKKKLPYKGGFFYYIYAYRIFSYNFNLSQFLEPLEM